MITKFLTTSICGVLASAAFASDGFVSLFNGKDLSGWVGEGYVVQDGVITCTKKGRNLHTEKKYENYTFEFEFKLPPAGNNGLGIHYPGKGDPAYKGMEIQILDDTAKKYAKLKPSQYHGGLYKIQEAQRGYLKPVGEWNQQRVTVQGKYLIVELNGVVINVANLDALEEQFPKHEGLKLRSGYITFCGHGDAVQFKNIRIREVQLKSKK